MADNCFSRRRRGAVGLLGLACLASCIAPERHRQVLSANGVLRDQLAELTRANQGYQDQIQLLRGEVDRMAPLVKDAAYLKKQKELVDSILARWRSGGTELPAGVEPVATAEGLALRVEGRILFASGSDKLSESGMKTLRQLVATVRSHPGNVRVAGHTDSDPIKHSSWITNMRLSVARALRVREFLISEGLAEAKLSVAGYGEFQPVNVNDKAKNRRTEIILLR